MSNEKSDYKLTEEEQKKLADVLDNSMNVDDDFNQMVEEQKAIEPEPVNKKVTVDTVTDTQTGETFITGEVDEDESGFSTLAEFGSSLTKTSDNFTITGKEIADTITNTDMYSGILKGLHLSENTLDTLARLANERGKDPKKVFTINDIPNEVRGMLVIADSAGKKPVEDISPLLDKDADDLITDLYSTVSTKMMIDYANTETAKAFSQAQEEIFPLIQDYENKRNDMLREALKDVPDTDEDKQYVENSLDAMADSYNMDKLKEFAHKCKIKKFQLEKPAKVFDTIHNKYRKADIKYNIYSLTSALPVLSKHLFQGKYISSDDAKDQISAKKFLIAFTKYCMNFDVEDTYERTYMYYTLYYIYLLTTYKGEAYEKFANPFLTNVMEVANNTH